MSVDTYTVHTVRTNIFWFDEKTGTGYIVEYTADGDVDDNMNVDVDQGGIPEYIWEEHCWYIEDKCRAHAGRVLSNWTNLYTTNEPERTCVHCSTFEATPGEGCREDEEGDYLCCDCVKLLKAAGFLNEEV